MESKEFDASRFTNWQLYNDIAQIRAHAKVAIIGKEDYNILDSQVDRIEYIVQFITVRCTHTAHGRVLRELRVCHKQEDNEQERSLHQIF